MQLIPTDEEDTGSGQQLEEGVVPVGILAWPNCTGWFWSSSCPGGLQLTFVVLNILVVLLPVCHFFPKVEI